MRNTKNLLEAMPLAMLPTKSLQHCQDQMILAIIFFYKFIAILYKLKVQFCNHTTFLLVIIFRQHLNFERISILKEPRQWQKKNKFAEVIILYIRKGRFSKDIGLLMCHVMSLFRLLPNFSLFEKEIMKCQEVIQKIPVKTLLLPKSDNPC